MAVQPIEVPWAVPRSWVPEVGKRIELRITAERYIAVALITAVQRLSHLVSGPGSPPALQWAPRQVLRQRRPLTQPRATVTIRRLTTLPHRPTRQPRRRRPRPSNQRRRK